MNKFIKQAFTLIELLVVIAIIGILSGLIVVSMSGVNQKATIAKAQVFSNSLRNSLMANIVGEWKFDGMASDGAIATNNDVLDTWGGLNNGSVAVPVRTHTPTVRAGSNCVSGSCLEFNGTDDYVSVPHSLILSAPDNLTVVAWFKTNSISSGLRQLVGKQTSYNEYRLVAYDNTIQGHIFSSSSSTVANSSNNNTYIKVGVWYYAVMSYDKKNLILYVNGVQSQSSPSTLVINPNAETLSIGRNSSSAFYFSGLIDDVRIYNAAMSAFQIKEQYFAGLNKLWANGGITSEEYQNRIGELAIK